MWGHLCLTKNKSGNKKMMKFFLLISSFVLHLTSVSGADWKFFSEPYSMINLLNLNFYKIFQFCPHMIFDQILNGTPIFFSKFEDLWTGEFFFLLANTIGNVEKVLKKIGNTQFSFYGHQRVGVPPWWRRFSKNGTNHEKASRPSNFGHIFKKNDFCNQWSIFY